jgi:hypothetical protein
MGFTINEGGFKQVEEALYKQEPCTDHLALFMRPHGRHISKKRLSHQHRSPSLPLPDPLTRVTTALPLCVCVCVSVVVFTAVYPSPSLPSLFPFTPSLPSLHVTLAFTAVHPSHPLPFPLPLALPFALLPLSLSFLPHMLCFAFAFVAPTPSPPLTLTLTLSFPPHVSRLCLCLRWCTLLPPLLACSCLHSQPRSRLALLRSPLPHIRVHHHPSCLVFVFTTPLVPRVCIHHPPSCLVLAFTVTTARVRIHVHSHNRARVRIRAHDRPRVRVHDRSLMFGFTMPCVWVRLPLMFRLDCVCVHAPSHSGSQCPSHSCPLLVPRVCVHDQSLVHNTPRVYLDTL